MTKTVKLKTLAGEFAENKDVAKKIRVDIIHPALKKGDKIVLDFTGVAGATQSFIHALISDPIREFKEDAFQNLAYKNVNDNIRSVISIVYRYLQETDS